MTHLRLEYHAADSISAPAAESIESSRVTALPSRVFRVGLRELWNEKRGIMGRKAGPLKVIRARPELDWLSGAAVKDGCVRVRDFPRQGTAQLLHIE